MFLGKVITVEGPEVVKRPTSTAVFIHWRPQSGPQILIQRAAHKGTRNCRNPRDDVNFLSWLLQAPYETKAGWIASICAMV